MLAEMRQWNVRWTRFPVVRQVWSVVFWMLVVIAYFGGLMAPFILIGMFFKAAHNEEDLNYWSVAWLPLLIAAFMFWRIGMRLMDGKRRQYIDFDALVGVVAVLLAIGLSFRLFPPN